MHLWQAIKMAAKSLWTNKLRSFLTMLGIIIGVMTVALLTSVASGVQGAIVSQIRSQSTLAVIMGTQSNELTYSKAQTSLDRCKPEDKNADDYYEYSIVKTATRVIANGEVLSGYNSSDIKELLIPEKLYTDEDLAPYYGTAFEPYISMYKFKVPAPVNATINAVGDNFVEVYDMDVEGEFPDNSNEALVDEVFIETYLGKNLSVEEVIGKKITIGIENYNTILVNFKTTPSADIIAKICQIIANPNPTAALADRVYLSIMEVDGSSFILKGNQLEIKTSFYKYKDVQEMQTMLKNAITADEEILTYLADESSVSYTETYDATNAKVFEVTGVAVGNNEPLMGGTSSKKEGEENKTPSITLNGTTTKGNVYVLLNTDNFECMKIDTTKYTTVESLPISYVYLRYKDEDVMDNSTSMIMVDMVTRGRLEFGTDFMMVSMSSVASIVDNVMNTLTIMLTVISIVSLIIGGIGIMNIMLVAVTERTREIGIRKAIGAKRGSILTQFLVEALMLSLLGGAIGLGISAIGCAIIGHFIGFAITMPLWVIGMSVGFCTFIGLAFGMFPAIKASHMQPIDALRRD